MRPEAFHGLNVTAGLARLQLQNCGRGARVFKDCTSQEPCERPHAGFVATLDNGQIWVQNEMESLRVIDVGAMVTIKPGMLGSFWLVGPSGRRTKAHRVQ